MNGTTKAQILLGLIVATVLVVATMSLTRLSNDVSQRSRDASPAVTVIVNGDELAPPIEGPTQAEWDEVRARVLAGEITPEEAGRILYPDQN